MFYILPQGHVGGPIGRPIGGPIGGPGRHVGKASQMLNLAVNFNMTFVSFSSTWSQSR